MKLEIELIPKNSWYKSLRNHVSKKGWDEIRKRVYKEANYKCEICDASGRLYCHEVWKYDNAKHKQTLMGFKALCENCHYIKHLGLVNVKIASNELPKNFMETLINHFCRVNRCDKEYFEKHRDESYQKWILRSCNHWGIDFKTWKEIINKKQLMLSDTYD